MDGIDVEIQPADLDRDGVTGGLEKVPQKMNDNITTINQPTEVGEVMKTMFPQENQDNTKMLGNIGSNEETYILAFLILSKMGISGSKSRDIVLEKLMLSVSRQARGRDDGRDIMVGKRENDQKMGGMARMGEGVKGFFGMGGR